MSDPSADPPPPSASSRLNFTGLQFILFAGAALVGLAALSAAGLAFGFALAGAAMLAILVLVVWLVAANLMGDGRRPPRR